jgi:hypothetical protein
LKEAFFGTVFSYYVDETSRIDEVPQIGFWDKVMSFRSHLRTRAYQAIRGWLFARGVRSLERADNIVTPLICGQGHLAPSDHSGIEFADAASEVAHLTERNAQLIPVSIHANASANACYLDLRHQQSSQFRLQSAPHGHQLRPAEFVEKQQWLCGGLIISV